MKTKLQCLVICFAIVTTHLLHAQGYIVPNGVTYAGTSEGPGYSIDVIHDPINGYATGFSLVPLDANTFRFSFILDIGVRVFFVSPNNPITANTILSGTYTEPAAPSYVFSDGVPFYLGLYTGNMTYSPPSRIYDNPLFGWVELVNNQGVIEMLGGALEYQGGGIYAGTQTIIPVPEPGALALVGLGGVLLGWRRWRTA